MALKTANEAMDDAPALLVCFAVQEEAAYFSNPPAGCKVLITGIGRRNAAAQLVAKLETYYPSLVLSCGFAGGLNPQLQFGTVLFAAEETSDLTSDLAKLGLRPARFYCADRVASAASEKHRLWLETQADAVEMESGAIRQICRERRIPCLTIRVISDAAQNCPRFVSFSVDLTWLRQAGLRRCCRRAVIHSRFRRRTPGRAKTGARAPTVEPAGIATAHDRASGP